MFLAKIASGLHYLHSKKIIHRDLKAGNVLVTELFEPLIADFGLSCNLGDDRAQGEGTLAYSAPELFDGEDHSPASDIYAFAMVVWFVATASEPNRECEEPWADKTNRGLQADVLDGERPLWPKQIMGEELERFRLVRDACSVDLSCAYQKMLYLLLPAFVYMLHSIGWIGLLICSRMCSSQNAAGTKKLNGVQQLPRLMRRFS